jgi:hypothetical protein
MTSQRITYQQTATTTYLVRANSGQGMPMLDVGFARRESHGRWIGAYREDGVTHSDRFGSRAEAGEWLARRALPVTTTQEI